MAICIIVDGNNLAHSLFSLGPGKLIPLELDVRLVQALDAWASSQERKIEVELCLDPRREKVIGTQSVTVFMADPGSKADGMIVGKVSHRVYTHDSCLVVTNDEDLRMRVAEYQVRCIPVRDFILSAQTDPPTFAILPAKISKGAMPDTPTDLEVGKRAQSLIARHSMPKDGPLLKPRRAAVPTGEYDQLVAQTLAGRNAAVERACHIGAEVRMDQPDGTSPQNHPTIQQVRLTLDRWPVQAGVKFLKESFCPLHSTVVAGLFIEELPFGPTDMPVLAEFLLDHCGSEADFVSRGGCLMDRVRLALLQSAGTQLTFQEIAAVTHDSLADIKHKVHQNANRWLTVDLIPAESTPKKS